MICWGFRCFQIITTYLQFSSQKWTCFILGWTTINVPNDLPRLPHCEGSPMRLIRCAVHSHRSSHLYLGPADRTVRPIVSPALDRTHRYLDIEPMSNTKGTEFSLRPYETADGEYGPNVFSRIRAVLGSGPASYLSNTGASSAKTTLRICGLR